MTNVANPRTPPLSRALLCLVPRSSPRSAGRSKSDKAQRGSHVTALTSGRGDKLGQVWLRRSNYAEPFRAARCPTYPLVVSLALADKEQRCLARRYETETSDGAQRCL